VKKGEAQFFRALRRRVQLGPPVGMPTPASPYEAWMGYRLDCLEKRLDRIYWVLITALLADVGLRVLGVL
jgi:hypothetical protein